MARNYDLSIRLRAAVEGLAEVGKLISEIDDVGGATEGAAKRSRALSDEIRELEKAENAIDNFRRLKDEVNDTGDELQQAQQRAQALGRELGETSTPTAKLKRDFESARKTVQRLKDTQQEQTLGLQKSRKELETYGLSSQRLNSAQAQVRDQIERTTREIYDLTDGLKEARDQAAKELPDPTDRLEQGAESAGKSVDTLSGRIKRLAGVAIGSAAAFFGIREAIQGITGIVRVGGDFEILQKRLEALTGSVEAGEEAFAWIKDFTRNTPFQLDQVTDAFVRAKAFGLDPMDGTLQAIADQAAKTGGGMEALNGIVTALGQAYSKGKIQAEEMLQLVERGVPAWDLLAQATGRSVAELQKMTTAGELGRREIGLLIEALGESGAGAASEQMNTLQGLISNAKDTFVDFLNTINEAGLLEYAKLQIRSLADAFEEMRRSGELQQWAKRISDAIIGLVETLKTVAGTLYEYRDAIVATTQAWIAFKAVDITKTLLQTAANIAIASTEFAVLTKQAGRATGRMGAFRAAMGAIPGPAKVVALGAAFLGLDKILVRTGTAIGEWAARLAGADDIVAEAQRRLLESSRSRLSTLEDEIAALSQYRSTRQVTAEEAIALSEAESSAMARQLEELKRLQRAELARALMQEQLGENTKAAQKEISEAIQQTNSSLHALANAAETAGRAVEAGISAAAQSLVEKFRELTADGETAAEAVAQVFEVFDASNTTSVRTLVEAIGEIATESQEAAQALDEQVAQTLSDMTGDEILRFSIALRGAFDGGSEAASRFADLADRVADAALKQIGTSLQEIRTGISEMETDALAAFQTFAESGQRSAEEVTAAVQALQGEINSPEAVDQLRRLLEAWAQQSGQSIDEVQAALDALAADVKGTAEQITAELSQAIASAGDEDAINAVRERIRSLYDEGKIGAEDYTRLLAGARDRVRELGESSETAGQQTADSMGQAADSVRELGDAATEAERKIGDTATRARGIAGGLAAFYNTVTANLISLSQKAHDAFQYATGGQTALQGLDAYRAKLEQVEKQIQDMTHAVYVDRTGIIDWMKDTSLAASRVEADFYRQKIALEDLIGRLDEGGYAGRFMSSSIDNLSRRFDLLDDQDLSRLQSSIQRVQAEVDGLNDSLQDTISSLRQELASLEGDSEEVERLRYQEQRLELEAQLQRARALGDREAITSAQEALNLAQQAYNLRLQQARLRSEEEAQRAAEQAAADEQRRQQAEAEQRERQAQDFAREDRQAQTQSQRPTQTIILQGADGTRVPVTTDNPDDLLSVLESLGRRVS